MSNGQLPASQLKAIPGGQLRTDAAWSWLRLRQRIANETKGRVWICPTSSRTAYRTYAEQVYFWNLYTSGRGNLAARPGTSNHGWGIAVDVPAVEMAQLINRYGAEYGWQKRWSDAPSEWWHFRYAEQYDKHKGERPVKPKPDAEWLTKREARARRIVIRERRLAKKAGGWDKLDPSHLRNARASRNDLREYRAEIVKRARKGPKKGWNRYHRRERHNAMGRALRG